MGYAFYITPNASYVINSFSKNHGNSFKHMLGVFFLPGMVYEDKNDGVRKDYYNPPVGFNSRKIYSSKNDPIYGIYNTNQVLCCYNIIIEK